MTKPEKLLPQNVEAEAGVLGSLLIDPEALWRVVDVLRPEDFYREAHRVIYAAMLDLFESGSPADLITLTDELARRGKLDEIGGASYVSSLGNQVPTSRNVRRYAEIVERTGVLRRIINAAGTCAGIAYDEPDAEAACAMALETILAATRRSGANGGGQSFREVLDDLASLIHRRMDTDPRGGGLGVRTGFEGIDRHTLGLQPGELVYVLARPGGLKTTLCCASIAASAALDCAARGRGRVDLFTMEMRSVQVASRIVAAHAGLDTRQIRAGFRDEQGVDEAAYDVAERTIRHLQEVRGERLWWWQGPISLAQFRARVQRGIAEAGTELVVVDQLNKFTDRHRDGQTARMQMLSQGVAEIAKTLGVVIICAAQLNRAVESRADRMPQMSDAKDSGQIEEDADMVWALRRPIQADPTSADPLLRELLEVHMLKVRDGMAEGTCIPLRVDMATQRIEDWPYGVRVPGQPVKASGGSGGSADVGVA